MRDSGRDGRAAAPDRRGPYPGPPAISMLARRTLDVYGIVRSHPIIAKVFMHIKQLFPHLTSLRFEHVAIATDTISLPRGPTTQCPLPLVPPPLSANSLALPPYPR